jgi:hypothetical protein
LTACANAMACALVIDCAVGVLAGLTATDAVVCVAVEL